jgi:hypothetical protein
MYCTSCGRLLDEADAFCSSCGKATTPIEVPAPPAAPVADNTQSIAVFILGLLSVIWLGLLTGIPAWVMARYETKKARRTGTAVGNPGLMKAGLVLGIIGSSLWLLVILAIVAAIVAAASISDVPNELRSLFSTL